MRNFTTEDFAGAGQYLIRMRDPNNQHIQDTGYLSTVMYKVGYMHGHEFEIKNHRVCLISMSDGWVRTGYFTKKDELNKAKFIPFIGDNGSAMIELVNYLNNPLICEGEYRFATQEEVVRVVLYQKSRWR